MVPPRRSMNKKHGTTTTNIFRILAILGAIGFVVYFLLFTANNNNNNNNNNNSNKIQTEQQDQAQQRQDAAVKTTASSSASKTTTITKEKTMGFTKEILRPGNGQKPRKGQEVTVHCTGYGKNRDLSQKFWSTKDAGQKPFTFAVGMGGVIKGWDESVIDMSIGEIARIHCSPDYAYGAGGFPAWGIMPNSELVFEIEVLSYA